jgi:hypothetical protein
MRDASDGIIVNEVLVRLSGIWVITPVQLLVSNSDFLLLAGLR